MHALNNIPRRIRATIIYENYLKLAALKLVEPARFRGRAIQVPVRSQTLERRRRRWREQLWPSLSRRTECVLSSDRNFPEYFPFAKLCEVGSERQEQEVICSYASKSCRTNVLGGLPSA